MRKAAVQRDSLAKSLASVKEGVGVVEAKLKKEVGLSVRRNGGTIL